VLWTADGSAMVPTRNDVCFWQSQLPYEDGSEFSCVAVPQSERAVAIAGVGIFQPAAVPAKRSGFARVGVFVSPQRQCSPRVGSHHRGTLKHLPGTVALMKTIDTHAEPVVKKARTHMLRSSPSVAITIPLKGLGVEVSEVDDLVEVGGLEGGVVLQLFELSGEGVVYTVVRDTSDSNMAGGSHNALPVPAGASSRVARGFLSALLERGDDCSRLASRNDHHVPVAFDRLLEFSQNEDYSGLCLCRY